MRNDEALRLPLMRHECELLPCGLPAAPEYNQATMSQLLLSAADHLKGAAGLGKLLRPYCKSSLAHNRAHPTPPNPQTPKPPNPQTPKPPNPQTPKPPNPQTPKPPNPQTPKPPITWIQMVAFPLTRPSPWHMRAQPMARLGGLRRLQGRKRHLQRAGRGSEAQLASARSIHPKSRA